MNATVTVSGSAGIFANLRRIDKGAQGKVARKVLRTCSKAIAAAAKAIYPVRTGKARKAIKVRAAKRKKGVIGVNVQVGDKWFTGETFYAGFVEWGTKYMQARQPLQQAFNQTAPRLAERMPYEFWSEIQKEIVKPK